MTHIQNALNLTDWIRKLFEVEIVSVEPNEYEYTVLGFDDKDIEIDVWEKGYTVRAMSWFYEFKEPEQVLDFIKGWKLLESVEL